MATHQYVWISGSKSNEIIKSKIMKTKLLITLALLSFLHVSGQKPEENISDELPFTYKTETVRGLPMAYYEQGVGDPILFLHGIPENSYVWRNVVPEVSKQGRAIALDLAGFGKSGILPSTDYAIQAQYEYLNGFIERLNLRNITLVVTDIGSMLGLKYATEHPQNIKGVILMEAMYMPSRAWYGQLKFKQKMMFSMMSKDKMAKKMLVDKNKMPSMMLKMAVVGKPSDKVKSAYAEPFDAVERRNILLYGIGPHTMQKKGISKQKGDFSDVLDKYAAGLIPLNDNVPFYLIHAKPGMIVNKKALEYAKANFRNITLLNVGKGKHYLTEDHPTAIANGISEWLREAFQEHQKEVTGTN